jgi:hypothetical protein
MHSRVLAAALSVLLTTACAASNQSSGRDTSPSGASRGQTIHGEQLQRGGGSLLNAMVGRVQALRVTRSTAMRCPEVTFRGLKTIVGNRDPVIYVDGTYLGDTCILDQIAVHDVDRVEIYPGGMTNRVGYRTSPNGLILVFRVREAGGAPPERDARSRSDTRPDLR